MTIPSPIKAVKSKLRAAKSFPAPGSPPPEVLDVPVKTWHIRLCVCVCVCVCVYHVYTVMFLFARNRAIEKVRLMTVMTVVMVRLLHMPRLLDISLN